MQSFMMMTITSEDNGRQEFESLVEEEETGFDTWPCASTAHAVNDHPK